MNLPIEMMPRDAGDVRVVVAQVLQGTLPPSWRMSRDAESSPADRLGRWLAEAPSDHPAREVVVDSLSERLTVATVAAAGNAPAPEDLPAVVEAVERSGDRKLARLARNLLLAPAIVRQEALTGRLVRIAAMTGADPANGVDLVCDTLGEQGGTITLAINLLEFIGSRLGSEALWKTFLRVSGWAKTQAEQDSLGNLMNRLSVDIDHEQDKAVNALAAELGPETIENLVNVILVRFDPPAAAIQTSGHEGLVRIRPEARQAAKTGLSLALLGLSAKASPLSKSQIHRATTCYFKSQALLENREGL